MILGALDGFLVREGDRQQPDRSYERNTRHVDHRVRLFGASRQLYESQYET
jgi:hypothetical protein